jgi:hypothetical protein
MVAIIALVENVENLEKSLGEPVPFSIEIGPNNLILCPKCLKVTVKGDE